MKTLIMLIDYLYNFITTGTKFIYINDYKIYKMVYSYCKGVWTKTYLCSGDNNIAYSVSKNLCIPITYSCDLESKGNIKDLLKINSGILAVITILILAVVIFSIIPTNNSTTQEDVGTGITGVMLCPSRVYDAYNNYKGIIRGGQHFEVLAYYKGTLLISSRTGYSIVGVIVFDDCVYINED